MHWVTADAPTKDDLLKKFEVMVGIPYDMVLEIPVNNVIDNIADNKDDVVKILQDMELHTSPDDTAAAQHLSMVRELVDRAGAYGTGFTYEEKFPGSLESKAAERQTYRVVLPNGREYHSMAPTPRKAYANAVVRFLRESGLSEGLAGLYINQWEDDARIDILPPEPAAPPPAPKPAKPEQLDLPGTEESKYDKHMRAIAFHKESDSKHPGAIAAGAWKEEHRMQFVNIDQLKEVLEDSEALISVKMDGELVAIVYDGKKAITVTAKGTIRSDMPATDEATKLLANYPDSIFLGEIYAVDKAGVPQSYMKAASVIRDPDSSTDDLIRLAVFDVARFNGADTLDRIMEEKKSIIEKAFKDGKLIKPVTWVKGGYNEAQKLWSQMNEQGWEGLVIHYGDQLYKVKPIMSYDLVVVAIDKSPKYIDRIGAVLCSFIDKDGRFRLNGSVSGGFTDKEKVMIYDWAERNKVREDEDRIWVDPFKEPLIVEVEAAEVHIKDQPKMQFKDGKWVEIEQDMSGTLRFPHISRIREDKTPTHRDVPIEQLQQVKKSHIIKSTDLRVGNFIETITGHKGKIRAVVPNSGDSGFDLDYIVEWDPPLWDRITVSEVHPTEVIRTWR